MDDKDRQIQHLIGTHEGAAAVAELSLAALIQSLGLAALPLIDGIERKLTSRYKNSEIPADHELKHGDLVKPVIDEVERLISAARDKV